jgi:DNA-binding transcriptional LysR family regulator
MELATYTLRYFVTLAEELHFGRAAERLMITSSSLSEQIAKLEAKLHVPLFDRTSRKVELTDQGRELLQLSRPVLRAHDEIVQWATGLQDRGRPVLRVGFISAGPLTTPILAAAMEGIPDLRVEARRLGFTNGPHALLDHQVDVAIIPEPLPPMRRQIRKVLLWTEPRVLVVPRGHPFAGLPSVAINQTNAERFIVAPGAADIVNWWVVDPRPDGTSPTRGPLAETPDEMLEMCAAGLGVNLAPASLATYNSRPDIRFVPVQDIPSVQVMLCRLAEPRHPDVIAFERIARAVAAGHYGEGATALG